MTYATYFIPAPAVDGFKSKLDALARKAQKLGAGAILYVLAKTFSVPHPDVERAENGEVLVIEAYTVKGEPPRLEGWEFAATLQHETDAEGNVVNLIHTHADYTIPAEYRDIGPDHCDHCHTRRWRNDTFIVRNVETGEFKHVGRQCLKDFLGYNADPGRIADLATSIARLFAELEEGDDESWGGGGGSSDEIAFDISTFLSLTAVCIDANGWVSRGAAKEAEWEGKSVLATANHVWYNLTSKNESQRRAYALPTRTERTFEEVKAALAWLAEQDDDSDYIANCQTIVKLGRVTYRTAGYLASVLSSYRRAQARLLYKTVLKADGNAHVGTVGKREEFLLTLVAVFPVEGFYGTTYIHKFADRDGNQVTWFASNPEVVPCSVAYPHDRFHGDDGHGGGYKAELIKGATYRVTATVKEHGEYKGQAQTKISRLSVLPIAKKAKASKASRADLIKAVRDHAVANYNKSGWDFVVETYDDADLDRAIGKARSVKGAIKNVKAAVSVKDEQRTAVQLEAF